MTETQFDVLKYIAAHPCIPLSRVSEDLGRDALRVVMGMQNHRYIEKNPLGLVITPKGFEIMLSKIKASEASAPAVTPKATTEKPLKPLKVVPPVNQVAPAPKVTPVRDREGWVSHHVAGQRRWFKPLRVMGETQTDKGRVIHLNDRATGRTLMIEGDVHKTFAARDLPRGMTLDRVVRPLSSEKIIIEGKVYTLLTLERDFAGRLFFVQEGGKSTDDVSQSPNTSSKMKVMPATGIRFMPL